MPCTGKLWGSNALFVRFDSMLFHTFVLCDTGSAVNYPVGWLCGPFVVYTITAPLLCNNNVVVSLIIPLAISLAQFFGACSG